VIAENNTVNGLGDALAVLGRATFLRAGVVDITSPDNTATVFVPGGIASSALALATVQNDVGVYVTAAVPDTNTGMVEIILNSAPGMNMTAKVGWFVLDATPRLTGP
jgi:hypothetical protein